MLPHQLHHSDRGVHQRSGRSKNDKGLPANQSTATAVNMTNVSTNSLTTSRMLLDDIRKTEDLVKEFKRLKERGGTREERKQLEKRVAKLKEEQLALSSMPSHVASPRPATADIPQQQQQKPSPRRRMRLDNSYQPAKPPSRKQMHDRGGAPEGAHRLRAYVDPTKEESLGMDRTDIHTPNTSAIEVRPAAASLQSSPPQLRRVGRDVLSSGRSHGQIVDGRNETTSTSEPVSDRSPSEQRRYWRSVSFAIVLAEAHTRKEIMHKWEKRWMRALLAFREGRIKIALNPQSGTPPPAQITHQEKQSLLAGGTEETDNKREVEKEAEVHRKTEEEIATLKVAEKAKRKAEEEAEAKRKAEEEEAKRRAEEEAEAKRKAEEEAEAKRRAEEEEEAKRKAEEEAEAKRKAEEEAEAKRKAEEEAEAKRKTEEAEAKRRAEEEEEAKRKAEEEAKRKAEEEEAKRRAEEEAEAKRKAEEAEAKRRAEEEEEAKRKAEEEAEAKRKAEEEAEAKRKAEEEEAKRRAEEEAEAKRKAEEEAEAKRKAEEEAEAKRKAEKEAEAKRKAEEEEEATRRAEEEAAKERNFNADFFPKFVSLSNSIIDESIRQAAQQLSNDKESSSPSSMSSSPSSSERKSPLDNENENLPDVSQTEDTPEKEAEMDWTVVWNIVDKLASVIYDESIDSAAARHLEKLRQKNEEEAKQEQIQADEERKNKEILEAKLENERSNLEKEEEEDRGKLQHLEIQDQQSIINEEVDSFNDNLLRDEEVERRNIVDLFDNELRDLKEQEDALASEKEKSPSEEDISSQEEQHEEKLMEEESASEEERPSSVFAQLDSFAKTLLDEFLSSASKAVPVTAEPTATSDEEDTHAGEVPQEESEEEELVDPTPVLRVAEQLVDEFIEEASKQVTDEKQREELDKKNLEEINDLEALEQRTRDDINQLSEEQIAEMIARHAEEEWEKNEREKLCGTFETDLNELRQTEAQQEANSSGSANDEEAEQEDNSEGSTDKEDAESVEKEASEDEEEEMEDEQPDSVFPALDNFASVLLDMFISEAAKQHVDKLEVEAPSKEKSEDAESIVEEEERDNEKENEEEESEESEEIMSFSPVEKEITPPINITETVDDPEDKSERVEAMEKISDDMVTLGIKDALSILKEREIDPNVPICTGPNVMNLEKSLFDVSNGPALASLPDNASDTSNNSRANSPPLHITPKKQNAKDINDIPSNTNNAYLSIDNRIAKVLTDYVLQNAGEDLSRETESNAGKLTAGEVERILVQGLQNAVDTYQQGKWGKRRGSDSSKGETEKKIPLFCLAAMKALAAHLSSDFTLFVSSSYLSYLDKLQTQGNTLLTEEEELQMAQELFATTLSPKHLFSPQCLARNNIHNLVMALLDMSRKGCDREPDGSARVHPLLQNGENLFKASPSAPPAATQVVSKGGSGCSSRGTNANSRRSALTSLVLSQCLDNITDLLVSDSVDWVYGLIEKGHLKP